MLLKAARWNDANHLSVCIADLLPSGFRKNHVLSAGGKAAFDVPQVGLRFQVLGSQLGNFLIGVDHRRMVAIPEALAETLPTISGDFAAEVNAYMPRVS